MSTVFQITSASVLQHRERLTRLVSHTGVPTLGHILVLRSEVFDISSPEVLVHEETT